MRWLLKISCKIVEAIRHSRRVTCLEGWEIPLPDRQKAAIQAHADVHERVWMEWHHCLDRQKKETTQSAQHPPSPLRMEQRLRRQLALAPVRQAQGVPLRRLRSQVAVQDHKGHVGARLRRGSSEQD
jgi:hypothetical protein